MSDTKKPAGGAAPGTDEKTKAPAGEIPRNGEPVNIGNNVYVDPVYYYSRERRLNRASEAVKSLNDGSSTGKGFSRGLFATKAHVMLFITIILLCAMLGLVSRFSAREKGVNLGGNILALIIFPEEGELVLGIAKNAPESGEVFMGAVDIAVSPVMEKAEEGEKAEIPPVFTHRIFFNPLESETYRIPLPFTEDDFFVLLKTETEQKTLRIRAGEPGK